MKLKSIKKIDYNDIVYNLRIKEEDNHNYFANDICVSNCHQGGVASIKTIISKCTGSVYRFGLSGTLPAEETAESLTIQSNLGPMVMKVSADFLFKNDYATPIEVKVIRMDYLEDELKEKLAHLRDKKEIESVKLFNIEKKLITANKLRLEFVCKTISKASKNSLILFQSVAEGYGKAMYDRLREMNADKEFYYVDGDTSIDLRDEYKFRLESGTNRFLIATVGTFSTGISIKNLHNLFIVESFKSEVWVGQSLGRLMRQLKGKEKTIVVDFVDNYSWKGKYNYVMRHSDERIKIYEEKNFPYKIYNVSF